MTALLLVLIALFSYYLGGVSGSWILSRYVFRRSAAAHRQAETPLLRFYQDFGVIGCLLLVLFDVCKAFVCVKLGGWIFGFVGEKLIGRLFATFCLLLGQCYPMRYVFQGGQALVCAAVSLFLIDWRIGLSCTITYLVVIIFTRYRVLGCTLASILAPIFMWIFDVDTMGPTWLPGILAVLCSLVILSRQLPSMIRLFLGRERRVFDFSPAPSRPNPQPPVPGPLDTGDVDEDIFAPNDLYYR